MRAHTNKMATINLITPVTLILITSALATARLNRIAKTYDEASQACEARNSWLVRIKNNVINRAVFNLISADAQYDDYWIGARELNGVEGQWRWNDGTTLGFKNWHSDEPNESEEGEDCVAMFDTQGTWNDLKCNAAIGYVCQSDLNPVVYVGATELSIMAYVDDQQRHRRSYFQAKRYCNDKGSKLVEIKTEEIQTALSNKLNELGFNFDFWTSGNDIGREGSWEWGDGTDIPLTKSSAGYENWKNARPNGGAPHNCLFLSDMTMSWQWDDYYCRDRRSFICQKELLYLSPTRQNIAVNARQNLSVLLNVTSYDGLVNIRVFKEPSTTPFKEFYNIGNGINSFILGQVTEESTGYYRFVTSSDFTKYNLSSYAMITAYDYNPPTIQSVMREFCSAIGRITVTWIPGEATYGVNHRFILTMLNDSQEVIEIQNLNSSNAGDQLTTFTNLQSSTKYQLQIKVCPDLCIESLTAVTEVMTGNATKPPSVVMQPMLHESNRNDSKVSCVVRWSWLNTSENITGFQINLTSTLVHRPSGISSYASSNDIFSLEENQRRFIIPTSPNRNYTAQIQAVANGCHGPSITAHGSCLTLPEAPDVIPAPTNIEEGRGTRRKFTLIFPDESNGFISCFFVIARQNVGTNAGTGTMFSAKELRKASEATSQTEPEADYISQAFQRSNFTTTNMEATLGDESESNCNVRNFDHTRKKRQARTDDVFHGKNFPLKNIEYRIFVVTTTPLDDGNVLIKASDEIILNNIYSVTPATMESQFELIIGLGSGLVFLIFVVILLVILLFRRNNRKEEQLENEYILGPMPSIRSTETETTYESLSGQHQQNDTGYDTAKHIEFTGISEVSDATYDYLGDNNQPSSTGNNYDTTSYRSPTTSHGFEGTNSQYDHIQK